MKSGGEIIDPNRLLFACTQLCRLRSTEDHTLLLGQPLCLGSQILLKACKKHSRFWFIDV